MSRSPVAFSPSQDTPSTVVSGLQLTDLLAPEAVAIPLRSREKEALIRELAGILAREAGISGHRDEITRSVLEREAVLSTGIGGGVALPHGKSATLSDLHLAAGTSPDGVDFAALDGQPVHLVFMLVGPEAEPGAHVRVLSRLGRVLGRREVRQALLECRSPGEFVSRLREAETA